MAWDDFRGASQAFDAAVRALHRSEGLAVGESDRPDKALRPGKRGGLDQARLDWNEYHPRLTRAQQARKRRQQEGS